MKRPPDFASQRRKNINPKPNLKEKETKTNANAKVMNR